MHTALRRSTTDKVISGVCGGLGRRFGVDTAIVRLSFLASIFLFCGSALLLILGEHHSAAWLFLLSGLSFCFSPLVYLILWVVMPKEPQTLLFTALQEVPLAQALIAVPSQAAYNPTREWRF